LLFILNSNKNHSNFKTQKQNAIRRQMKVSRRDLGRGILGLDLEGKMETNEIRLLSSIDGF
jgi:hypothetical protein